MTQGGFSLNHKGNCLLLRLVFERALKDPLGTLWFPFHATIAQFEEVT